MSRDEVEIVRKDGSTLWCDVTSRCIRNDNGSLILTGVARPIIERSQVEKDLRVSEERYSEILNSVEEGHYECDLEGATTFFNEAESEGSLRQNPGPMNKNRTLSNKYLAGLGFVSLSSRYSQARSF